MHYHICYWILACGNCNVKSLHRTALFQKRAIRTTHNAKFNSHTDPLLKATSIMQITDQYISQSTLFVFDFITKYLPYSFEQMFRFNYDIPNSRATRLNQISCMKPGAKPMLPIHCRCMLSLKYWTNGFIHYLRTCLVQNSKLLRRQIFLVLLKAK